MEVAAKFLESGAVGNGNIDDPIADFDSAAVLGQFRADRFFPGIVQGIDSGAFQESAGADEVEHGVADGAWESGEWNFFGRTWQVGMPQRFWVSGITT